MNGIEYVISPATFASHLAMTVKCYAVMKELVPDFQKIVEAEHSGVLMVQKELCPELYNNEISNRAFASNMAMVRAVLQFVETVGEIEKTVKQQAEFAPPPASGVVE